jgi:hypothetical protein
MDDHALHHVRENNRLEEIVLTKIRRSDASKGNKNRIRKYPCFPVDHS